jgi:hypothetical protein
MVNMAAVYTVLLIAPMFVIGWYVGNKAMRPPASSLTERRVGILGVVVRTVIVLTIARIWLYVADFAFPHLVRFFHAERYEIWVYQGGILVPFIGGIIVAVSVERLRGLGRH